MLKSVSKDMSGDNDSADACAEQLRVQYNVQLSSV